MLLESDVLFEYITFSILPPCMLNTIVKEWSHTNILRFNPCKYVHEAICMSIEAK